MWASRLPPIELELLAEAFLPLLSGCWRGIICQHAGSHCIWAGTNAVSIRQLDPGVCTYSVCGSMSHMYTSTSFFLPVCTFNVYSWCMNQRYYTHKHTGNHKTKSLHFYVNGIVGRSLSLYVYVGLSLPAHMTLLEASGSRTASYSPALGKKKCHYNTVAYLAAASLPRCVKGLFPKDTSHSAALLK